MRQGMIRWGAIEKECPKCQNITPIYPNTIFGGNKSTECLNCGESLQYKDGQAVLAQYNTASPKSIEEAEERDLESIANISHYNLGIPKHKLSQSLQERLPKPTFLERIGKFFNP